jgi:hypothetical protein
VGGSTVGTILANRLVPGLLDRYLGRTGYRAQQTDDPEDTTRPFNLWEPVDEDRGARGEFDDEARPRSIQAWLSARRRAVAVAGVAGAALAASLATRR